MVAPLSSEEIEINRSFEVLILNTSENGLEKVSKILLNRVQTIDKIVRLKGLMGKVSAEIMEKVNKGLKLVLDLG